MTKRLTILGSTGSIGKSTLRVVRSFDGEFSVYGLTCGGNIDLLEKQIEEFNPEVVAVESAEAVKTGAYRDLKSKFGSLKFLEGHEGVVELAGMETDVTVSAIVGAAGLKPSLAAVHSSKRIALANKETLVMAGDLFMEQVMESGVELIPVDSEHSAIFSLLKNVNNDEIERIILTASGGSLREVPVYDLPVVTPVQALDHPVWDMGNKITIDSATLMNKGLEVIEAHHLFAVDYEKIDVIIHPESVVHSMVETIDGSLYSHMGVADMAFPILNALKYPQRVRNSFGRLRLDEIGMLHFSSCDNIRYPSLELCYQAGKRGGTMPAVLNAANEVAVAAFLKEKILFTEIVEIVEKTMNEVDIIDGPDLDEIVNADIEARDVSKRLIKGE